MKKKDPKKTERKQARSKLGDLTCKIWPFIFSLSYT